MRTKTSQESSGSLIAAIEVYFSMVQSHIEELELGFEFKEGLNEIGKIIPFIKNLNLEFPASFQLLSSLSQVFAQLEKNYFDNFRDYKSAIIAKFVQLAFQSIYYTSTSSLNTSLHPFNKDKFFGSLYSFIDFFYQQNNGVEQVLSQNPTPEIRQVLISIKENISEIQQGLEIFSVLGKKTSYRTSEEDQRFIAIGTALITIAMLFQEIASFNLLMEDWQKIDTEMVILIRCMSIYFVNGIRIEFSQDYNGKKISLNLAQEKQVYLLPVEMNSLELSKIILVGLFEELKSRKDLTDSLRKKIEKIDMNFARIYQFCKDAPIEFSKVPAVCFDYAQTFQSQCHEPISLERLILPFARQMERLRFYLEALLIYNKTCHNKDTKKESPDHLGLDELEIEFIINNFGKIDVSTNIEEITRQLAACFSANPPTMKTLKEQLLGLNDLLTKTYHSAKDLASVKQCVLSLIKLFESEDIHDLTTKQFDDFGALLSIIKEKLGDILKGESPKSIPYEPKIEPKKKLYQELNSEEEVLPLLIELDLFNNLLVSLKGEDPSPYGSRLLGVSTAIKMIKERIIHIAKICQTHPNCFSDNFRDEDIIFLDDILQSYTEFKGFNRLHKLENMVKIYGDNITKRLILAQIAVSYYQVSCKDTSSSTEEQEEKLAFYYVEQLKEVFFLHFGGQCIRELNSLACIKNTIVNHFLAPITEMLITLSKENSLNFTLGEPQEISSLMTVVLTCLKEYQDSNFIRPIKLSFINPHGVELPKKRGRDNVNDFVIFLDQKSKRTRGNRNFFFSLALTMVDQFFAYWEKQQASNFKKEDNDKLMGCLAMSLDMIEEDVPRDGNCLFTAIAHQLLKSGFPFPDNDLLIIAKYLRKQAVAYVTDNKEQYREILKNNNNYIENMKKNTTWADHLIIQALLQQLTKIYSTTFKLVIISQGKPIILGQKNGEHTLCVGYTGSHYYTFWSICEGGHKNNRLLQERLGDDSMIIDHTENNEHSTWFCRN